MVLPNFVAHGLVFDATMYIPRYVFQSGESKTDADSKKYFGNVVCDMCTRQSDVKTRSEAFLGSDSVEYPEYLKSQSRRRRIKVLAKRMFRKLPV